MDNTTFDTTPKPFLVYWAVDDPATRLRMTSYLHERLPNATILQFDSIHSLLAALNEQKPGPDMILFNDSFNY